MTEDLIKAVRERYVRGPRAGARATGDDFDNRWKRWWARIRENAEYRANERAVKDERNTMERRSIAKKRGNQKKVA